MKYVEIIFQVLAGIGVLLIGCRMLSDNMEKLATSRIKKLFLKTSDNKIVGVGIGAATTALVQSSGLTLVMVVGLVNAGIMTLNQATTVIIGANIGTTITAQIASLQSFNLSAFAIGLAGIGAFINVFTKKEKIKLVGNILSGLGMVFIALSLMSKAMVGLKDSQVVVDALKSISNPLVLFLLGAIFTALIQSSATITTIIISMAAAGIAIGSGGNSVLFVILGSNVGSCMTGLISSIGANTNARRASFIHLLFNVFGSLIFFVILLVFPGFMDNTFGKLFSHQENQIAMFHTFFNVICGFLFLPFTNIFVKLATFFIKDKEDSSKTSFLEMRLLNTPSIAIEAATRELCKMLDMSVSNLDLSITGFIDRDDTCIEKVKTENVNVNNLSKQITDYLIYVSSKNLTHKEQQFISSLHDANSDIVRISEIADNVTKYTAREINENLAFSDIVKQSVYEIRDLLFKQANNAKSILLYKDFTVIGKVNIIEDEIDDKRKELIKGHIERLKTHECRPESSNVFLNLANNLERCGDHLYYIAHSIDNI